MDDLISRQAAIDVLNEVSENYTGKGDRNWHPHIDFMVQAIEELPSAQPDWNEMIVICDCCGHAIHVKRQ